MRDHPPITAEDIAAARRVVANPAALPAADRAFLLRTAWETLRHRHQPRHHLSGDAA